MNQHKLKLIYVIAIVLVLALFRLIPHPPNVTPIAAMAIFSGAYFTNRILAYVIPLLAMIVSDLLLGFHSSIWFVYTGVVCTVFLGGTLKEISFLKLGGIVLLSSVVFYLLTNFGAWLSHDMYTHDAKGLMQAYIAGLPFFRNSILGNLFFTYVLFYMLNLVGFSFSKQRIVH